MTITMTLTTLSPSQDEMDTIEAIIDRNGMANVMLALVHICGEKADHLRSSWQDEQTARNWDNVSDAMISERLSKYLNRLP